MLPAGTYPIEIDQKFGDWVTLRKKSEGTWICRCTCGTVKEVDSRFLLRGKSKSCGCKKGQRVTAGKSKHGRRKRGVYDPTLWCWANMIRRCTDPNNPKYPRYGGRGITICDRWIEFDKFLLDMGEKPKGMTLDRRDNEKGYNKQNCRWASLTVQSRNRGICLPVNRRIELRRRYVAGEPVSSLAKEFNIHRTTVLRVSTGSR